MRIDSDLYAGVKISPYYDSMIAKVIVLGENRHEAIEKLKRLLSEMVISGIKTNQNFYLTILEDQGFLDGTFNTDYLERVLLPEWKRGNTDETV